MKIAFLFIGALVVMLLWNALMPDIFSLKELSYWQSVGLLLLARILTGNFYKPGGPRMAHRGFGPPRHLFEKWKTMTPEERDRFKEEWRKRCAGGKRFRKSDETSDLK
ncbi:hypothetical protein [Pollutibacter soli]|uniref:hypothetical protein n=1 Tax=Pollutibacter soli TaxID=3034157 RepID=UPI0030135632